VNQHQQIIAEFDRQSAFLKDAILISPSALAHRVFETFSTGAEEPHIQYTSLEHLKHMARGYLRRNDADSDDNPTHGQPELPGFSGQLQDRYPLPRPKGEEPAYKLRHHLTAEERAWNVKQLRKSAQSRLEHADALEAEGQMVAAQ
jgi:hypothetical protein